MEDSEFIVRRVGFYAVVSFLALESGGCGKA